MSWEVIAGLIGTATLILQIVGAIYAIHAIMISRTPQAAIGWAFALMVLPILAIPLFLIFGESRFSGYTLAGRKQSPELDLALKRIQDVLDEHKAVFPDRYVDAQELAFRLRGIPATTGNAVQLLVNGEQAFDAMFKAINTAKEFLVVQFFIIHDDKLGRELKKLLLEAAQRGARCWLLYDKIGSKDLPLAYVEELLAGGVSVNAFVTNRQRGRRFQINFRNHRKLVIVDGRIGFLGGLNIGDEYLHQGPLGTWRDTHLQIEGPAVLALQASFLEDWYYVSKEVLHLPRHVTRHGEQSVMTFASGPAETWSVTPAIFLEIIHDVRHRLWIASPYFVADTTLRTALAHAALRGVDVRIILPQNADHLLPWLSSFTFYPMMLRAGVKIWRYQPGFMHQKVLLADDDLAIVSSVNLDFRSFMLNFELGAVIYDKGFAATVEKMFETDFTQSKEEDLAGFDTGSFFFRLKCRLAALMSPEQ